MLDKLISFSTKKDQIKIEIEQGRLRPIDADLQIPDLTKFKTQTNWEPEYTFEETMLDLLNYWREKVSNPENNLVR
jgi:GDPmannose 4,6-dehydratase